MNKKQVIYKFLCTINDFDIIVNDKVKYDNFDLELEDFIKQIYEERNVFSEKTQKLIELIWEVKVNNKINHLPEYKLENYSDLRGVLEKIFIEETSLL